MGDEERAPAEVYCLAEFLQDEMLARGLRTEDVAPLMGSREWGMDLLVLDVLMCVQKDNLTIDDKTFRGLARAFDVSPDFLRNLDATWRKWPDRRSPFKPDERIFGPISHASIPPSPSEEGK